MILSHFDFEFPLDFSESVVNVLVVENENRLYEFCKEILSQVNGEDGGFSLYEKERELVFSKNVALVSDVFSLTLNDKKISSKLFQQLQSLIDSNHLAEYTDIQIKICALLDSLNVESDYPIEYDEDCGMSAILKAYGVRFENNDLSLAQLICSYIHIGAAFLNIKLFIFINLKTFLSQYDLQLIYKEVALENVNLLLLENSLKEKTDGEKICVIDKDLCEFVV